MNIRTSEQVRQYLALRIKDLSELQAICEGFSLSTEGTKEELLARLVDQDMAMKRDIMEPQLIALRTVDSMGKPLEEAKRMMLQWRKNIFEFGKVATFQLKSERGNSFSTRMKYVHLKLETVKRILDNSWYLEQVYNKDMLTALKAAPENFSVALVLRKREQGSNWLMLYISPRKAA